MSRWHLFEWEDQPWLPKVFRDFITDHLRFTHHEPMRVPVNRAMAAQLSILLERTGATQVVDLCAGAGGPLPKIAPLLAEEIGRPVRFVVTDLFPNVDAFQRLEAAERATIQARYEPTDAANVPATLSGVRTLFTALHHFRPQDVERILTDAVRKRAPIAIFEPLERTARMTVLVGVMSFLRGFTHTHRVGKMTTARFFFTYIVPLAPAMFAWDGSVSALRSYSAKELREMASSVRGQDYEWQAGRFEVDGPYGVMPTTYLMGMPLP